MPRALCLLPHRPPGMARTQSPQVKTILLAATLFFLATGASAQPVDTKLGATVNASEAERRLAQARLKRRQGIAPLPGERARGSAAGVLNIRYWKRQEKLRLLVEQAQRRSNATAQRPQLAAAL